MQAPAPDAPTPGPDRRWWRKLTDRLHYRRIAAARLRAHREMEHDAETILRDSKRCHGRFDFRSRRSVWIHGETPAQFLAADPLLDRLRRAAPDCRFVFTASALQTDQWLAARLPNDAVLRAPWNRPEVVNRFFEQAAPRLLIVLEAFAGLSPLVHREAQARGVPIVWLGPGRRRGEPGWWFARRIARHPGTLHLAREEADAQWLRRAGLPGVTATGPLDYETAANLPEGNPGLILREFGLAPERRVIVAETVAEREEPHLLAALLPLLRARPEVTLLWETTTPGQRRRLREAAAAAGLPVRARSEGGSGPAALLLLDRPGETGACEGIAAAIVAGGSFTPFAEMKATPLSVHAPVLVGPHPPRSWLGYRALRKAGAIVPVSAATLGGRLAALLDDEAERHRTIARARAVMEPARGAARAALEAIAPLLAGDPAASGEKGWRVTNPKKPARVATPLDARPLADWAAFRTRLGPPRSLFCLGNGPTSESPEVATIEADTLFRANWRWQERGLLTRPDAVFVGDAHTLERITHPCVFVFLDAALHEQMLHDPKAQGRAAPLETFHLGATEGLLPPGNGARPTNGVLMVAVAAALQPGRLTLAGYDLFSHPGGRYPGDLVTVNTYAQAHQGDYELDVIEHALRRYRGELLILSPILSRVLAARGMRVTPGRYSPVRWEAAPPRSGYR